MQNHAYIADMHTHSEHSHDSVCPITDMLCAQIERGTRVMAVTDHFDTAFFREYDIHTPIRHAYQEVQLLNRIFGDQIALRAGVEISEGFWYPEEYKKILSASPYDVIIGSVHLVKAAGHSEPYSQIDFSTFSAEATDIYLRTYFEDMMTMLETTDFDILAHLTCPLRYITGKYGIAVELDRYEKQIDAILDRIIHTERALEINTSSCALLGDCMPNRRILQRYLQKGGKLLTLGSDAHVAQNASFCFDEVLCELRQLGVRELFDYQNRTPMGYSLNE